MIKELCKDEAVLKTRCAKATPEDAAVAQDLVDTLNSIEDGACLAANQIGVTKQVIAYLDEDKKPHVMYNPRLVMGLQAARLVEGCLTKEEESKVTRYAKVKVSYDELVDGAFKSRKRDFLGWEAQMIQHMIDHCNGKYV